MLVLLTGMLLILIRTICWVAFGSGTGTTGPPLKPSALEL